MLEHLKRPIPELVADLSPADLKTIQDNLARADAELKRQKEVFAVVMARRYEDKARAVYQAEKKDTGTVNLAASNTLSLKVEIDKKVEWAQDALLAIFNKMKPEDARHYAKVKYEVAEAVYKAAPPAVQAQLKTARTVRAGKMRFVLENAVDEAVAA
jgi:hypothetical protein